MGSSNLSLKDVKRLIRWPMPSTRSEMATKVAKSYNNNEFEENEKPLAEEIFFLLALDVESMVRKTLSESLKDNPKIPHQLAMKLATDLDEEVAIPILQYSKVLNQSDLEEIIKNTHIASRLCAIALRNDLTDTLCTNLIDKRHSKVVINLAKNDNAPLNENNLELILHNFKMRNDVLEVLVNRGNLPLSIVEELISIVSDELYQKLINDYDVTPIKTRENINTVREKVLLNVTKDANSMSIEELVNHLDKQKKLTHSIILRALCKGDLLFFELAMAKLASITSTHAHRLILDHKGSGFNTLYKAAGMPNNMLQAIKIIYNIIIEENKKEDYILSEQEFADRITKKIKDEGYDKNIAIMPYLLILINNQNEDGE